MNFHTGLDFAPTLPSWEDPTTEQAILLRELLEAGVDADDAYWFVFEAEAMRTEGVEDEERVQAILNRFCSAERARSAH
jgi:hypothetical protein